MGWLYTKRPKTLTTNAAGGVTGYDVGLDQDGRTREHVGYTGELVSIRYVKDDYAGGVDFTITVNGTAESIWTEDPVNASKIVRPLVLSQDGLGADLVTVYQPIVLVEDRIKFVIAGGGDTKSGTFIIVTRHQV